LACDDCGESAAGATNANRKAGIIKAASKTRIFFMAGFLTGKGRDFKGKRRSSLMSLLSGNPLKVGCVSAVLSHDIDPF
jgi:hypothetical protein